MKEKKYTYHRNPTRYEIKFGYGATHYDDCSARKPTVFSRGMNGVFY